MRFTLVSFLSFLLIWSCENKKEEIKVGKITERTPEEVASIKEYAPMFSFNSIDGKTVSLSDLKGKFVYMDIWATWCGPCRQQIPAMKEIEERYRGKNIEFLSVSVDKDADKAKWEKMVNEQGMKGIQLFAGKGTSFHQDYQISTIPRFLLIGTDGEIISKNAPRPMDYRTGQINQELVAIFDALLN
jgi:thiol-disulfide isomerase/thioredoxin